MKISLFGDVHANLPALHSFFNSIDAQHSDALYWLGDLVGYHIWPTDVTTHPTPITHAPQGLLSQQIGRVHKNKVRGKICTTKKLSQRS